MSIFALNSADAQCVLQVAQGSDTRDAYSRPRPSTATSQFPARLQALGGQAVEIDFSLFLDTARLLYEGAIVAERYAAIRPMMENQAEALNPVPRQIIAGASKFSAADAYDTLYQLQANKAQAAAIWQDLDLIVTPTAGTIYTIAEVEADPIRTNSNLGYYTNFMNLLDLSAIAVPAGFQRNGLPFGITLCAPAFSDDVLIDLAGQLGV